MRTAEQGLCNATVFVRLSDRLSNSPAAAACGKFAAVGPASRSYRSIAARGRRAAANAGSATFTADVGG